MSLRHGSHLALLSAVLLTGCQSFQPEQTTESHNFGLAEPDSLIQYPSNVAEYPAEATEKASRSGIEQVAQYRDSSGDSRVQTVEFTPSQPAKLLDEARAALEAASSNDLGDPSVQRAKQLYQQVLEEDPGNAEAHHRLAVMCDLSADFENAESHYREALAKAPHDPSLISDIGYSYQLQQRPDVARKFFERALLLEPGHSQAANNLGRLHAEAGDYEKASEMFHLGSTKENAERLIAHFFPNGKETQPTKPMQAVSVSEATTDPQPPTEADNSLPEYEPARLDLAEAGESDSLMSDPIEQQAKTVRAAIAATEQQIQAELSGLATTPRTRAATIRSKALASGVPELDTRSTNKPSSIAPKPVMPQPAASNVPAPTAQPLNPTVAISLTQRPVAASPGETTEPPQYPGAIVIEEASVHAVTSPAERQQKETLPLPLWNDGATATSHAKEASVRQSRAKRLPPLPKSGTGGLPIINPRD